MTTRKAVFAEVRKRLWETADAADWMGLTVITKNRFYDNWARDPEIGQRLARYLEPGKERSYIKDTLMKIYTRERMADPSPYFLLLGIPQGTGVKKRFIKPMGCILVDGRVICWGQADRWKLVVLTLYERCYGRKDRPPAIAVLTHAAKHFGEEETRAVAEDVARRLGISLYWRPD